MSDLDTRLRIGRLIKAAKEESVGDDLYDALADDLLAQYNEAERLRKIEAIVLKALHNPNKARFLTMIDELEAGNFWPEMSVNDTPKESSDEV